MSFYIDLQNDISTRLNAWFLANTLSMKAVPMPETTKEAQTINDEYRDNSFVIVKFNKSTSGETKNINHVVQDEVLSLALIIVADLPSVVYDVQEAIEKCLLGYQPSICTKRITFGEFDKVDWTNLGIYDTQFIQTERVKIQTDDEEEILGIHFKKLSIIEPQS